MKKNDFFLIIIIILISFVSYLIFNSNKNGNFAYVYYDRKLIKTINLKIDNSYVVKGYNGDVEISVKDGKIKVINENSLNHLCSKLDYTNSFNNPIICLPNKIVIEIKSVNENENEINVIVK